ncbi:DUF4431 domain-containing protein [Enterobacter ludwigii]|uniref:DUF4431 domain-containing protein n=1 Tax=Enterobacter ludwigii TaxID=299767 RepID=UPI003F6F7AD7
MLTTLRKWIAGVFIILISTTVYADCLKEGDSVELSGIMKEEMFYGPPNWGEDKEHDKKMYYWILHLSTPLTCIVDANTDLERWNKEVQLVISGEEYKTREKLLNTMVTVKGTIFLAETGYHVEPVLLDNVTFIDGN